MSARRQVRRRRCRAAGAVLRRAATIVNRRGLHARAAARFVKVAEQFDAEIVVAKDDMEVCGTSIMGLMMLAAAQGSTLEIRARGQRGRGRAGRAGRAGRPGLRRDLSRRTVDPRAPGC